MQKGEKMEDFYLFKTKRKRSNYVTHKKVEHKSESFHFRCDSELAKCVKDLSKELGQTDSKVIKDILNDFFLDQEIKQKQFEISDI
jgi:predicted DNA-binding protein